jgi:hypothetical protein
MTVIVHATTIVMPDSIANSAQTWQFVLTQSVTARARIAAEHRRGSY